ncbi:nucleotidyl transferase AbiEii/AbiGii toxin family protein [Clostridium sp. MCC353]|uniref:nucleotidyl transferase AbiEii/AbiGii toxin family protein n=1 Tax=Clostridium sp. MCC353 TaxID=2592646 RepID=UPI001C02A26A|nr:nucleotidyl transferase AbiEii/AbiGii toxin family protein [Clostridium sp. MCC353]MBT9777939.1 nucleotidyl transferase AbiEii/AbiGii toxin family protein [Clostridium sp. MCC353]
MRSGVMSLKAKINNYAKNNKIAAQVVLQNYMFERFLERLSKSVYREKFVIKGGMLIAAIVGLDTRSTMDLDTTLLNFPLTEEKVKEAVKSICSINLEDEIVFELVSIAPIRKDDQYGGFCVRLNAVYDTIITPLSIDVSTGDIMTPYAVQYEFGGLFDNEVLIRLWGYNIETVMAEKVETVLRRGAFNTRPRDYYDIYILGTTQKYDEDMFKEALKATSVHRGSAENIADTKTIITLISESDELRKMWEKYQKKFVYARDISFEQIIKVLNRLVR